MTDYGERLQKKAKKVSPALFALPLGIALGILYGILYGNLALGIAIGTALGVACSYVKQKKQ